MLRRSLAALAVVSLGLILLSRNPVQAQKPAAQPAGVDFARDIQPILETQCYECHGPKKSKADLRLDRRAAAMAGGETGAAILPGNSEQSLIVRRLLGLDGDDQMPKDGDPLPAAQIALIRTWIDQGATWPDATATAGGIPPADDEPKHWAYRRPSRAPLPEVRPADWVRTPIDRFILARLEKEGLKPSPEASLETLVRRVSLDLIGLPPSPQEVDEVLADAARDGRDEAYARLVDRLLASPHYGERWARPWLDLARYADSHGFEKDLPRVMWKYRDWVIDALNQDMPFDRFTIEQIAGDMLSNATPEQKVASGFHRNAMTNEEGGIDPEEAHHEVLVDRVNTTAAVWLGSTLGCAQCHNHKYDPFSQKDYYRMMAFFANSDYEVRKHGDGTKFSEAAIDLPTPDQEAKQKTIQAELDEITELLATPTAALDREQAVWEQAMRAEPTARWTPLAPLRVSATGGVVLTTAGDGSVLASGANPGETTYTVEAHVPLPRVMAIRLEALPDPSLPKTGPGRDVYGNFQVNGFDVIAAASGRSAGPGSSRSTSRGRQPLPPGLRLAPSSTSEGERVDVRTSSSEPLKFRAIKSDEGGASLDTFFPKALSRDLYAPRGWRIDASRDQTRQPRQIVFTLEQPLTAATAAPAAAGRRPGFPGTRLRIHLKHQGAVVGQSLGRFRLSVTSSASPQRVVEIPAKLRPILSIAPADRTEQQRTDLATLFRTVAASLKPARERMAELQKALKALGIPTALVMRERVAHERPSTYVRRRGSFLDKGQQVHAGVPEFLHALRDDQMPNRLGLARWLVDEENPLTSRVAVNRAWEQLFGRGLVETSEDFGTQGSPPSHPELLDWLATELVRQKWHTKALHKLIVSSATYRQSSAAPPASVEADPYNRLVARGPRFRMDAEMVRDAALTASGLLSRKIGGPSVFPPQPDGIWDIPYSSEKWVASQGEDRYRRGLYVFIRRSATYPSFMTFDATSREHYTVRRVRTNTPLQALTTLNDEAFFEAAVALAARVLRDAPSQAAAQRAAYAFRLVVTRVPTPEEVERIVASYNRHLERFRKEPESAARVIKGPAAAGFDAAEHAAWTLVANALLNLDEALTRE
jgi:mono/diheme cytochrome c family protein